ncbi:putative N-acetyltransferase YkwB [Rossellomorea marisflavi]|uniref:GNAT family N-acetyltransferase n=1 Tax=Rossellomorea marisflavi TaxID=189381 RepID=UPI0025C9E33F|nr:GNAT family N-acetyltransferase [Rossellomorea marisflavi]UTE71286.1 GNAT family N-acetyltransferase [Rossellomorea marisflavi]GLI86055.1 putative N-acetyltransferase YkwB [Rossellomorea marisflavi]
MYVKKQYVFRDGNPVLVTIRNYREEDFDSLISIQQRAFPPPFPEELWWNKDQLHQHVNRFPLGAICVEMDGLVVGSMTSLITSYSPEDPDHTWDGITDEGYITNHSDDGNTLYVVDLCIDPAYRGLKLGKWMMDALYEIVVHLRLERLLGGGRIPTFHSYRDRYTVEEYVEKLTRGEHKDPVITFLLQCGRMPVRVIKDYLEDEESCHYGILMEWKNPFSNIKKD